MAFTIRQAVAVAAVTMLERGAGAAPTTSAESPLIDAVRANDLKRGPAPLTIGTQETLFVAGENGAPSTSGFDIAADGRLLMTRKAASVPGDEARAVLRQNWMEALAR